MKSAICLVFIFFFIGISSLIACDKHNEACYPSPKNYIDEEIDYLLTTAEYTLFQGEFRFALDNIEKASTLLSLTSDLENYRKLRILFDKAIAVTCLEGPTENSLNQFKKFEALLDTKSCTDTRKKQKKESKPKQSWSLFSTETKSPEECIKTVDNTIEYALIAARKLPITKESLEAIESSIHSIGTKSKECCTENGFWKTCLQPLIDAIKNMTIFGTAPKSA